MEYKIIGTIMPLVEFTLNRGEAIQSQTGAMKYMSDEIKMSTNMTGGLGGFIKRSLMGESGFLNFFECEKDNSKIAFGHTFPGKILPMEIGTKSIICQKRSYLCSTGNIALDIAFQKKLGTGFFGGEGFIMQRISGNGMAFIELDGEFVEINLSSNEKIKVETGAVGMFEETVNMNIEMIKGVSNMLFGGEGLFLTTLTGPGKVWIQTMAIQSMAGELFPYLPMPNKN